VSAVPLVEVRELKKWFPVRDGVVARTVGAIKAVDGVSFTVTAGETLGLVGESGCGKTTTGRMILGLIPPTSGEVLFEGQPVFKLGGAALRRFRHDTQVVFQDPYASLNPRMSVGEIVAEPLLVHRAARGHERVERVEGLLAVVGLDQNYLRRFPHELSGGQRQRVGIARALALNPKFVVCDEPVSALDVSVRSQVLNLLERLQARFGLTYLFISHDLSVVKHISTRVGVMYLGKLIELADKADLYRRPAHPYSRALISAIPRPDPEAKSKRIILEGDVPSPADPPAGCRFHVRCRYAMARCKTDEPALRDLGGGHLVACHLAEELPKGD
jgi:oligopeptide/dipeptide ABC transporter ATP-binding protein